MDKKDKTPTFTGVLAVVNRKYGFLTKYEPGRPARQDLSEEAIEMVDLAIEERNELRLIAQRMARLNLDVLEPVTPRAGTRRGRSAPRRPTRN